MKNNPKTLLLLALILGWLGVSSLHAQVVQYTDRAAWETAVVAAGGSVQTETFNDGSQFTGVDNGTAVGPPIFTMTFDTGDTMTTPLVKIFCEVGSGGQQFIYQTGAAGELTDGTPYLHGFGTSSGAPKIRLERPSGSGVIAWGVDYRKNANTATWRAELVPFSGSVTTYSLPAGTAVGFIGWVAADGYLDLQALRLFTPSAGYVYCGYDNVSLGVPATPAGESSFFVEAPGLIVDGGTKSFGTLAGGSADVLFSARNTGSAALTGMLVSLDGADADQWQIVTQPANTVAAGATTTWTMRFNPNSIGSKTAAFHLASSISRTRNPYDVTLTGAATGDIAVEQPAGTSLPDGGSQNVGNAALGSSVDRVFTVRNSGSYALTGLAISLDGPDASDFSVAVAPSASLAPGGSTTFTIRFTANSAGLKSAALHLASNLTDAKNPFDLNLTARGVTGVPLSGVRTVGPTGDYASLTAAIADIQERSLGGPLLLELQAAYVSTVETFPLFVPTLAGANAVNTVTIRPEQIEEHTSEPSHG